jgi:uncharacterized surface anchored protein
MSSGTVINPATGKQVKVGGAVYNRIVVEYPELAQQQRTKRRSTTGNETDDLARRVRESKGEITTADRKRAAEMLEEAQLLADQVRVKGNVTAAETQTPKTRRVADEKKAAENEEVTAVAERYRLLQVDCDNMKRRLNVIIDLLQSEIKDLRQFRNDKLSAMTRGGAERHATRKMTEW